MRSREFSRTADGFFVRSCNSAAHFSSPWDISTLRLSLLPFVFFFLIRANDDCTYSERDVSHASEEPNMQLISTELHNHAQVRVIPSEIGIVQLSEVKRGSHVSTPRKIDGHPRFMRYAHYSSLFLYTYFPN